MSVAARLRIGTTAKADRRPAERRQTQRRWLAVVAAVALLAGCTANEEGGRVETPAPAETGPPKAAAPDDSCGNVRASERPAGALPAPGKMPRGTLMADIQKRGRLIIGTSQDTLRFSSRNPQTGAIEGFDVDMGRQVAQAIFGDPDKIQIRVIGYDERVDKAAEGDVDLVADTMTVTCERRERVAFSTVYYEAGQKVLVSTSSSAKGIEDLGGRKVCAVAGSTSLSNIATVASDPAPVPVGRPGWADCLVAFQQNEVDAISTDDSILVGLAAQDPYAKVVGARFTDEPYGLAMSPEHPEFVRFVNQVLERTKADGTWKSAHDRWLGDFGRAPAPPKAAYR